MPPLNTDIILQGLTGLFILFWAFKEARKVKEETSKALTASPAQKNPMVAAIGMAWDRDQLERLLQLVERIAKAQEVQAAEVQKVAKAQEALANQQQADLQDKIDRLMDRLGEQPERR